MTCSLSKPIAIISLTALCRADPVTNEGSLETVPAAGAAASADAGASVAAGAAAGGAASDPEAAAGVDGTAVSVAGGAGSAAALGAAATGALDDDDAAAVAGVAFGCRQTQWSA